MTPRHAADSRLVITGSRLPMTQEFLAADVIVIDRADIEASTADSVADLLRREAGVQLSRNGGPGQSTGALLRGAAAVNTIVLVDAVRIGSATLGFAQLDGLSLAQVERIEVLRGPASSLYGADAVGGVVQVFTRQSPQRPGLEAGLAVGGYGGREASLMVGGRSGPWDLTASAGQERSRGVSALRPGDRFGNHHPDADGHVLDTAQARVGLAPGAGHRIALSLVRSRLNAQYDGSEFLPPTYAADNSGDFRNRLATDVAALDWQAPLAPGLSASARASHSVDDLHTGGQVIERYKTVRQQQSLQVNHRLGAALDATVALERLEESAQASGFSPDPQRRNTALVLALAGRESGWSWQADLRRDDPSDVGPVTTGRAGVARALGGGWRLRALAGTTFRVPSFNALHSPGFGGSTLRPERGRSVEAGVDWRAGASSASLTVYRNRVSDLIGYEADAQQCPADPAYVYGCARNIARATLQGASLAGQHRMGPLDLKAQLEFLDAKDQGTGQRLNRRAAHQSHWSADWQQGDWTWGGRLLHLGARPDGGVLLAAETTLDLSARWRMNRHWTLQAKLVNAADRDLQPVRDYQGLGRQAWLVLRHAAPL
ncbi:MAG: TonB-dependent receptor domain-containing protein [Rubrivivax sp.]